jgi:hypothetical protein
LIQNDTSLYNRINEELKKSILSRTPKKIKETAKANMAKRNKSKNAITNAVNMLRFEDKKITVYSVAKTVAISYNTAKQYEDFIIAQ